MVYPKISRIEDATTVKWLLLSGQAYMGFELPRYFSRHRFTVLLQHVNEYLEQTENGLSDISDLKIADIAASVNHRFYLNKDGKYAWRLLELQHPAIYTELVNTISDSVHWQAIRDGLGKYRVETGNMYVASDIIIPCACHSTERPCDCNEDNNSRAREEIKEWVSHVEKRSLSLAVRYNHLLHTDIFDFYGQIYTHTIAWAIHGKSFVKGKLKEEGPKRFEKKYLGGKLDYWLRKMREGQSNGIPQGSALMDLLAEIVLTYADRSLNERITEVLGNSLVYILRYRDDYRIFADSSTDAELALKELAEVLRSIGLRLNEKKTQEFDDIVAGSIKPDKWSWCSIPRGYEYPFQHLLAIYRLIMDYNAPGQALRALKSFRELLEEVGDTISREHKEAYIGILINIAYRYPKAIPQAIGAISMLVEGWSDTDVQGLIGDILHKFRKKPAHDFLEIWLQRLAKPHKIPFECSSALCRVAEGEKVKLWNSEWITHKDMKRLLDEFVPIDEEKIGEIEEAEEQKRIPPEETELFWPY